MKLAKKQRALVRLVLWVAGLVWAVFFLAYGLILMPAFMEIIKSFYPGNTYSAWISGVFYILALLAVVMIFFWFSNHLFGRKKGPSTPAIADNDDA